MIYSFCLGMNKVITKSSKPTVNRINPALKKMPKSAKFENALVSLFGLAPKPIGKQRRPIALRNIPIAFIYSLILILIFI
jgi:hypothetical protein